MPLSSGDKLGVYEIVSPLGAGGMGEVYRARDTKLGREVAIKVLPEEFTEQPQKLARFEREARLLAALNHPGIATLHGLEKSKGKPFLVMELVEGETLAERISRSPIPVDEALEISRQIAEALEAAHEKGVIHRDLKPANVKVDPEGHVKVLDFGLAKAFADEVADGELSQSPTLSRDATQAGIILGTAAYMSPEQAKGKTVDRRTDIFSFGVVLYEMLTGKKAFAGDDVSDVLASIIKMEPDWKALPTNLDSRIQNLLFRCIRKDRKNRLQAIGDVRVEIQEIIADPTGGTIGRPAESVEPGWPRGLRWGLVGALALLSSLLAWSFIRSGSAPRSADILSFSITLPPTQQLGGSGTALVAFSPDGTRLVYSARASGQIMLYLRDLNTFEAKPLPHTESGVDPSFSPDGRWLVYRTEGKLRKLSLVDGTYTDLGDCWFGGGTWAADGTIFYTPSYNAGLSRVPADGGTPEELTKPDSADGTLGHWWPQALPDGKTVLFTAFSTPAETSRIVALSLDTMQQKTVIERGAFGVYAPTGHIVFARGTTVMAVPFDLARLETTGAPVPVIQDVPFNPTNGNSQFSFSENGSLAVVPSSVLASDRELVWVDRTGAVELVTDVRRRFTAPRISPEGSRVAVSLEEVNQDIWIHELGRGTLTRLTFGPTSDARAIWTPDGKRIVYSSDRPVFDLFWKPADGSGEEETLFASDYDKAPMAVTPDGKTLIFVESHPETLADIWLLPLQGERTPRAFLATPFVESQPALSPNGRWLAYESNESGRDEVYVQAFPDGGAKSQISTDGGTDPVWARSGRELFYRKGDQFLAVPISGEAGFSAGDPRLLFEGSFEHFYRHPGYDVSPDGQRFLMVRTPPESAPRQFNVVINWFEELKRLVPTQ